jgi:hypothetical protein
MIGYLGGKSTYISTIISSLVTFISVFIAVGNVDHVASNDLMMMKNEMKKV